MAHTNRASAFGTALPMNEANKLSSPSVGIADAARHFWFELSIIAAFAALTLFTLFGEMPC